MYRIIPCNGLGLHLQSLTSGRGHAFLGKARVPTSKSWRALSRWRADGCFQFGRCRDGAGWTQGSFTNPSPAAQAGTKEPGYSYQRCGQRRPAGASGHAMPAGSSLAAWQAGRSVLCVLYGQLPGCFSLAIRGSWSAHALPRPLGRGRHIGGLRSKAWQLPGFVEEGIGLGKRPVLSFCASAPCLFWFQQTSHPPWAASRLPPLSAPAPPASHP